MAEAVYLDAVDYSIFIILLCLSVGIGVYFGFSGRKQQSTSDYLYGNRQMKAIPVGLSLYSSALSAISIVGIPYEIYNFGTHFLTSILGTILAMFVAWHTILPVFCGNLNIKTPYEYFERRFDYRIRLISTSIHIFHSIMFMPVILYGPSIVMGQMTQIPVFVCTSLIGGICIIYTTIGGFKTVIWTDTLQATIMLLACIIIAIIGVGKAGGLSVMWTKAQDSDIVHFFDMDPNPLIRITFWTSTIGAGFYFLSYMYSSAGALQRYMSVPGEKEARISTLIGSISVVTVNLTFGCIGLAMFAFYFKCDPTLNGDIKSPNQITSYFVTQTIRDIPGFNGLFLAGLISATLSTVSTELNTVGGLIYYDIILKYYKKQFIENRGAFIVKIIILINGILYLCIVPFVQSPHIFELSVSIGGITIGAKIGILLLGIFFPKINTNGVICGVIASISVMIWTTIGASRYNINSYYQYQHSTEYCPVSNVTASIIANVTTATIPANVTTTSIAMATTDALQKPELEDIFFLYRISIYHYGPLGCIITMLVAFIVSYITGADYVNKLDPLLVSPLIRNYVRKQQNTTLELDVVFNKSNPDVAST